VEAVVLAANSPFFFNIKALNAQSLLEEEPKEEANVRK
jgi:hypothetical protein